MSPTRLADHPDWWRVRDIMTTSVVHVAPTATYADVVDAVVAHGVSGLPVVEDGRVLGVITETDLVRREAERSIRIGSGAPGVDDSGAVADPGEHAGEHVGETAAELMTTPVVTASPDDDLPSTARKLLTSGCRRLPVVTDDGRLCGVVSRRDLLAPAWDYSADDN